MRSLSGLDIDNLTRNKSVIASAVILEQKVLTVLAKRDGCWCRAMNFDGKASRVGPSPCCKIYYLLELKPTAPSVSALLWARGASLGCSRVLPHRPALWYVRMNRLRIGTAVISHFRLNTSSPLLTFSS
jgi:hypothetical protein